jgi:hypothetical protein
VAKKRRAKGRFRDFIGGQDTAEGILPLTHITRAFSFDDMLDGDGLEPEPCDVFGEELIYLFYGRPAYRARDGSNARLEYSWPVVFIFDPKEVQSVKRVFPFDTGAFKNGRYNGFFDERNVRNDFELHPTIESARQIVGTFYQDHTEYFTGLSRKNVDLPIRQFEAQGIHEMAKLPGDSRDERSSAIEVQISDFINFRDSLLAIVIPDVYLDDSETISALKNWQIDFDNIRTYQTLHNMGGEAWIGQIYAIVRNLYEKLGYL